MQFMIEWKTKDPKASISRFLESGHGISGPNVKVLTSAHVVGEGSGYLLVEATHMSAIHAITAKWADVLMTTCKPVISDEEAAGALKA